ncbi:DUF6636 domain-containing protein [Cohaesibacter intestini]|uniref:DUF6636 domain-containing protein n=1 Tax=Cohaesibacter intestini TaxID=2211145 RepID=UPI0013003A8B|nr:DUF6636 domain-containing protein [Cohaesibacter intestini]
MKRLLLLLIFLAPLPAWADGFGFETPSGNIYCNGHISDGGGISCEIVVRQGPPARPKPSSCRQSWGHSFSLQGSGSAELICGPKPSRVGYSEIAAYGQSGTFGDITCYSERTGFTCENRSGHGFFLSRRKQEIF